jgi:hypothetical protein
LYTFAIVELTIVELTIVKLAVIGAIGAAAWLQNRAHHELVRAT